MSEHGTPHILPLRIYLSVFFALMIFTGVTVWVAHYDLGILNTFVAITIAVIKATIVILYFMHLKYSARITWVVAGAGFVWLIIMISLTLSDTLGRGWTPFPAGWN